MAHRNFARGEPPPPHSYEWAGVAKPPEVAGKAAVKKPGTPGTPVIVAVSETVIVKKKRPWLWVALGAAGGFLLGYKTASY